MNTRNLTKILLSGGLAVGAIVFTISGCGADSNPSDVSGNYSSVVTAAAVGGAIQGSDSGGTAYYTPVKPNRFGNIGTELFGIPEAQAAVCGLSNYTCAAGVQTVNYAGCTSKNGRVTFTGGYTLTLGGTVLACPGSGFWVNFFSNNGATLFRQFTAGTSISNVNGFTISANNTTPAGWDTAVTLTKTSAYNAYGMLRTTTSALSGGADTQNLMLSGVEHVATGVSKKGVTVTLWDHTLSFTGTGLTVQHTLLGGTDTKVVSTAASSLVVDQHNLAKWTGKSTMANVTYIHGATNYCGCFPTAGTISTSYTGTKSGCEVTTFNYDATTNPVCGSYSIQAYSDTCGGTASGTAVTGVLANCL